MRHNSEEDATRNLPLQLAELYLVEIGLAREANALPIMLLEKGGPRVRGLGPSGTSSVTYECWGMRRQKQMCANKGHAQLGCPIMMPHPEAPS